MEPNEYQDPQNRAFAEGMQDPSTGIREAVDLVTLEMLEMLCSGPEQWQTIAPPELSAAHVEILKRMASEDPSVQAVLEMTWLQSQAEACCRLIFRKLAELELWAVSAGRLDLLKTNADLMRDAHE